MDKTWHKSFRTHVVDQRRVFVDLLYTEGDPRAERLDHDEASLPEGDAGF